MDPQADAALCSVFIVMASPLLALVVASIVALRYRHRRIEIRHDLILQERRPDEQHRGASQGCQASPGITDEDVVAAMRTMIRYKQRPSGEWLAVGLNGNSRLVELAYQYDEEEDFFFVFHGMTPPSGKTLRELGLERRA